MASTASSPRRKQRADLKVVILGNASIGKTTLIHRYLKGHFAKHISTIGASFSLQQWGPYNVALWDTAGEERFSGLSSFYCRGAGAAILACDLTCEDSFHALRARFVPLLSAAETGCLVMVVGCKADLIGVDKPRAVLAEDCRHLAGELNTMRDLPEVPYVETSSVTGLNVDKVFTYIFTKCLPLVPHPHGDRSLMTSAQRNSSVVNLETKSDANGCSC